MMELREYQQAAIDAIMAYWRDGGGNPLVEMATGTGKSVVIARLIQGLLARYPNMRVLMLVHVRELVEQNFRALLKVWPEAPIGVYSAGLGRRDAHHRITFGSIQSLYKRAKLLGRRDLILIDESHLVSMKGEGMYRRLLDDLKTQAPSARVAGFTATPYRLDTGRLDSGKARLFDETVYTYGIATGIEDGYLAPLVSKAGLAEVNVSGVERRGGEFVAEQLERAADRITVEAVGEMTELGQDRRSWLVFCSGVDHAHHVRDEIRRHGIACETVTGKTPTAERDSIIRRFREGGIRALTNAQVLTTGFDAPGVDMVAMLRPTLSTGLYVQIVGRGTRIAPGKDNCLVLDFAGNIRRHGPVDAVSVNNGPSGSGDDTGKVAVDSVMAKECPDCETLVALNATTCAVCGHEWPRSDNPKHEGRADEYAGILSGEKVPASMLPVVDWQISRHRKAGSPDSVRVTYLAGLSPYSEWLAFGHGGYPRQRACQWWTDHGGDAPFPPDADDALERIAMGEVTRPATISVRPRGKYHDIVGRSFAGVNAVTAEAAE